MHPGPQPAPASVTLRIDHLAPEARARADLGRRKKSHACTPRTCRATKDGIPLPGCRALRFLDALRESGAAALPADAQITAEVDIIIDRVLRDVGLDDDRQKMPSELSGRNAKARRAGTSLVLEPRILLVDEASSGLDRITASEIDELLLREKVERRTTLIVVTHDVRGARRVAIASRVLDQGRLIADGTVEEVRQRERDRSQFDVGEAMSMKKKASASSLSEARAVWDRDVSHRRSPSAVRAPHRATPSSRISRG